MALWTPASDARARQALDGLAGLLGDALDDYLFSHPVLLATQARAVLDRAIAEPAAPPWLGAVRDRIAILDRQLSADPASYRVGMGPVEGLWRRMDDGEVDVEAACELARSATVAETLTVPYVWSLGETTRTLARLHNGLKAVDRHRVVLAAVKAARGADDAVALTDEAVEDWIVVAHGALIDSPDRRLFDEARAAGDAYVKEAVEAQRRDKAAVEGQRTDKAARLLAALGGLCLDVYTVGRPLDSLPAELPDEAYGPRAVELAGLPSHVWRMPPVAEGLGAAAAYYRRAIDLAGPRRDWTKALMQTQRARQGMGEPVDRSEIADLARAVLADAGTRPVTRLFAVQVLQDGGEPFDGAEVDRALRPSWDGLVGRYGGEEAVELLVRAVALLKAIDPHRAVTLLHDARPLVYFHARPQVRVDLLRQEVSLLAALHPDVIPDDAPADGLPSLVADLAAQAAHDQWDVTDLAVAYVLLASNSINWSVEPDGMEALDQVSEIAPLFATDHVVLLGWLRGALWQGQGVNAVNHHDWDTAVRCYGWALRTFLAFDMRAEVETVLSYIADVAKEGGPELAPEIYLALGNPAITLERRLGPSAMARIADICELSIGNLFNREVSTSEALSLVQLAKGHRFGAAVAAGTRTPAPDAEVIRLLGEIAELERSVPDWVGPRRLSDALLVSPYECRSMPGRTPAERVGNLRRSADARMAAAMVEALGDANYTSVGLDELQAAIDHRTVLVVFYEGSEGGRGDAILTYLVTSDDIVVGGVIDRSPTAAPAGTRLGASNSALGRAAAALLGAVQVDPGPDPLTDAAVSQLETVHRRVLAPEVVDALVDFRAAGKDHLCVVPHGPLHFLPLHLLGAGGRHLADEWIVTCLPNLHLLRSVDAPPGPSRADWSPCLSVGVSWLGGGRLPPIPEAVDEACQVAAVWGQEPLLDEAATREAVLAALPRVRRAHFATHGLHNADAPAFQALFLAPEGGRPTRLCAHELAALDLLAIEVMTLGACESALGRFDRGDNLRGLPASLLLAGVRTVVGTLWDVNSEASLTFFRAFHQARQSRAERRDAFAVAQRVTRSAFSAVRDWGAFYLLGAWD